MSEFKKGDRVRVVAEGEVAKIYGDGSIDLDGGGEGSLIDVEHIVSTEKTEPPVEVFKVGDRLRCKDLSFEVTLSSNGYLLHHRNGDVTYQECASEVRDHFNSRDYEKVYSAREGE